MFKEYRKKYNYTQEELSEIIGIEPRTLQRIEKKENNPSVKTFRKLIKVLKITDKDIAYIVKNELIENSPEK